MMNRRHLDQAEVQREANRFAMFIEPELNTGCWLWAGAQHEQGYGLFSLHRRNVRAHRVSWVLANGPIPDSLVVCHKCDTPACVNPTHLHLGTQGENTRDAVARGLFTPPRGVGFAKPSLTAAEVLEIVAMRQRGERLRIIAERFGVSAGAVFGVVSGRSWARVTGIKFRRGNREAVDVGSIPAALPRRAA